MTTNREALIKLIGEIKAAREDGWQSLCKTMIGVLEKDPYGEHVYIGNESKGRPMHGNVYRISDRPCDNTNEDPADFDDLDPLTFDADVFGNDPTILVFDPQHRWVRNASVEVDVEPVKTISESRKFPVGTRVVHTGKKRRGYVMGRGKGGSLRVVFDHTTVAVDVNYNAVISAWPTHNI